MENLTLTGSHNNVSDRTPGVKGRSASHTMEVVMTEHMSHHHFVARDLGPFLLDLGERLTHLRTRRGVSQSAAAHAIGITPSYCSLIEAGKREPSLTTLANLVDFYGGQLVLEVRTSDAPRKLEDGRPSTDLVWLAQAAELLERVQDPTRRAEVLSLLEFHAARADANRATPTATGATR